MLCLISIVQQSDLVIYIYIYILFSITVYHRILNIVSYIYSFYYTVGPCYLLILYIKSQFSSDFPINFDSLILSSGLR